MPCPAACSRMNDHAPAGVVCGPADSGVVSDGRIAGMAGMVGMVPVIPAIPVIGGTPRPQRRMVAWMVGWDGTYYL